MNKKIVAVKQNAWTAQITPAHRIIHRHYYRTFFVELLNKLKHKIHLTIKLKWKCWHKIIRQITWRNWNPGNSDSDKEENIQFWVFVEWPFSMFTFLDYEHLQLLDPIFSQNKLNVKRMRLVFACEFLWFSFLQKSKHVKTHTSMLGYSKTINALFMLMHYNEIHSVFFTTFCVKLPFKGLNCSMRSKNMK